MALLSIPRRHRRGAWYYIESGRRKSHCPQSGNVFVWQQKQSRYPFPASNGLHALPTVLLYPFRQPFPLLLPSQRYTGLLTDNWQDRFEVPEVWQ